MKLITLADVTLISSTVAGSTYSEYDPATTYAVGQYVKVSFAADGATPIFPILEFESLSVSNTGNYPPDDAVNWIEVGAENKCKMFDAYVNTQTEDTSDIVCVLNANTFDAVGIFGIYGASVTLKLIRDTVTVKTETVDLRTLMPAAGWYSWLYNSYEYGISQIIWAFPRYVSNATLEITITTRSSQAKCGMVVMGNARELGSTVFGAKVGIDDYSIKNTDSLGRTYLNQGAYSDRADITMWLSNTALDYVKRQLTAVRGTPAIFDLNNETTGFQALAIYGYAGSFDIMIPGPIRSKCNLEINGLI